MICGLQARVSLPKATGTMAQRLQVRGPYRLRIKDAWSNFP